MCPACRKAAERVEASKSEEQREQDRSDQAKRNEAAKDIVITTEAWIGDVERLGIVAAEVVLGMNIFKDVLANIRDIFGGRSGVVQDTLQDAREVAFDELRQKAVVLGANMIIGVKIEYHSISTGSSVNMMLVAVTGTAIRR